jgi:hypothetical protein
MRKIGLFCSLFLLLVACSVDEASSVKHPQLIIASNFLKSSDTVLFSNFCRTNNLKIRIQKLSSDSIFNTIKNKGFNTPFSLVLLSSMKDLKDFDKSYFQTINKVFFSDPTVSFEVFNERKFLSLGINPFVFAVQPDTLALPQSYADLKNRFWATTDTNLTVFYAHLVAKKGVAERESWEKSLRKTRLAYQFNDTLPSNRLRFIPYSEWLKTPQKQKNKLSLVYPNQETSGFFADRMIAAIPKNPKDFYYAQQLLNYMADKLENESYAEKFGVLPHPKTTRNLNIKELNLTDVNEDDLLKALRKIKYK